MANGEIALEPAKELFWKDYKEGKRAWHTKDWKERKTKVIKDKCEICGSRETLTVAYYNAGIMQGINFKDVNTIVMSIGKTIKRLTA